MSMGQNALRTDDQILKKTDMEPCRGARARNLKKGRKKNRVKSKSSEGSRASGLKEILKGGASTEGKKKGPRGKKSQTNIKKYGIICS